ncbi:MAG: hypothetical protein K8R77_12625 [Anaerolineaceae bacterium]|nr:hypothetical protein [Anaerolineaceae bacterium]
MTTIDKLLGLVIVILGGLTMFLSALPSTSLRFTKKMRPRRKQVLRPLPAFQKLRRAIGLAIEDGRGVHLSLGKANILQANAASALSGLSTLGRLAQLSIVSDQPPIVTSGSGSLAILSQDTLQSAYRSGSAMAQYRPDLGRMTGPTSFSYVAGTMPIVHREKVYTNILIGNYGPEIALLCEAADRQGTFTIAASDALPAQAVLYATAQEPLIGEEMFAIPAYLKAGNFHRSSIQAQDLLRWVLIITLVVGAVLKLIESLLGSAIL